MFPQEAERQDLHGEVQVQEKVRARLRGILASWLPLAAVASSRNRAFAFSCISVQIKLKVDGK